MPDVINLNEMVSDTRTLLKLHRGRWPEVCERAQIKYSWLTKFSQGIIKEPGFHRLVRLRATLSKLQAEAEARKPE